MSQSYAVPQTYLYFHATAVCLLVRRGKDWLRTACGHVQLHNFATRHSVQHGHPISVTCARCLETDHYKATVVARQLLDR